MSARAFHLPPELAEPMPSSFPAALAHAQSVTTHLAGQQFAFPSVYGQNDLTDAMAYALEGGKAMRAFLVQASAAMFDVAPLSAGIAGFAIEAMHAYSLIHDDLPCMDDDDLRRGKPTVHRKWNEHTAVLAGDALQSLAFELVSSPQIGEARIALCLSRRLALAAGQIGMVGGQMRDIEAESGAFQSLTEISETQRGKTGDLICWSATAGAVLADEVLDPLGDYGRCLGLAFQIWDDVLDVEGDAAEMGKAAGKDADAGKATFVSHLGLAGAKRRAEELVTEASDALSPYRDRAETLRDAARFVISRRT